MEASGSLSRTSTSRSELEAILDGSRGDISQELKALKIGGLSRRCHAAGINEDLLEELQDDDSTTSPRSL